jgi:hypothetical protein
MSGNPFCQFCNFLNVVNKCKGLHYHERQHEACSLAASIYEQADDIEGTSLGDEAA